MPPTQPTHEPHNPLEQLLDQLAQQIASQLATCTPTATTEAQSSPWMSCQHAAAYLDWPKERIYKLTASSGVPHYKQDGRLLFHRHELDHWLQQYAQGERSHR